MISRFEQAQAQMTKRSLFLALSACLSMSACSYVVDNLPGIYRLEIQQGNIIDQAMVDQLRPGMSKRQILYIMGSPMLDDYFHRNRWEYVYYEKKGNADPQEKRLALFFNNDSLAGIQGDFRPGQTPAIQPMKQTTLELPKRNLDKTLWEHISELFY